MTKLTELQRKALFAKYAEEERIKAETLKRTRKLSEWTK
jgi:hypothetical protein